jgi:hypothetical protein
VTPEPPADPPSEPSPITPLTALRVDEDGRLTYMGQDGQRYVIVGDAELLKQFKRHQEAEPDQETPPGSPDQP